MVSDSDESLEPSPLTGTSLLLDGHDLQHLVLKGRAQEEVDDLKLLDGQGEEVDFFQGLDLSVFDKSSKLGHRDPFLLVFSATATSSGTTTTAASSSTTTSAATTACREKKIVSNAYQSYCFANGNYMKG